MRDTTGYTQTKVVVPSLDDQLHEKNMTNLFFPEKLMIKESCKLIGGIRLK